MNLPATQESPAVRVGLIGLTVVLLVTLLLLPLAVVFTEALKHGLALAAMRSSPPTRLPRLS